MRHLLALTLIFGAACGKGSGSSDTKQPPPPPPNEQLVKVYLAHHAAGGFTAPQSVKVHKVVQKPGYLAVRFHVVLDYRGSSGPKGIPVYKDCRVIKNDFGELKVKGECDQTSLD